MLNRTSTVNIRTSVVHVSYSPNRGRQIPKTSRFNRRTFVGTNRLLNRVSGNWTLVLEFYYAIYSIGGSMVLYG